MSLETGTYLNSLVVTNPLAGDPRSEGDDHIRLLKSVLRSTFPNLTGAVNPTQVELNYMVGVTSGVQAQINALSSEKASMPSGTVCLFYQPSAPTGWTQITTHHNKALRVVNTAGGGAAGTIDFTTAFASQSVLGTVGATALSINQLPAHSFDYLKWVVGPAGTGTGGNNPTMNVQTASTNTLGHGDTHTHTFTGTAINLAVKYLDVILASRN